MKTNKVLYLILYFAIISFTFFQIGCKKDNDETELTNENVLWAVGAADSTNYGTILFSADGGDNWVRQGEGNLTLSGVYLNRI